MKKSLLIIPFLLCLCSCEKDIVIDLEHGDPMIGVSGSLTDEYKRHEVVVSYTADFYHVGEPEMISDAQIYICDDVHDTIFFAEDKEQPGHYFTVDSVAGKRCHDYTLFVNVPDEDEEDGFIHLNAESYMNDNADQIDSLSIEPYSVPSVLMKDMLCVYPYFQSLDDASIVYLIQVEKNDTLVADTLTKYICIPIGGYAGYYVNGPEMLENNMKIPVAAFNRKDLCQGDKIKVYLYSIPKDYMEFVYNVQSSMGSNPLLGSPSNVMSNIYPKNKGVGWFYTASVISAERVYYNSGNVD